MTRAQILVALLAAGCGSVTERGDCRTSAACPAGEYCAHTPDGNVCWPDPAPPAVASVTVTCAADACLRDEVMVVTAEATDDSEVFSVEASVDFDPGRWFPLARGAGNAWTGSIPLAALAFPALAQPVVVTVRVRDGGRHEVTATAAPRQVTRVKWEYPSSGQLTPPAVAADGTVVFGRSDTAGQIVAVHVDGTKAWAFTLGAGTVTSAPSIGAQAIWVSANDGKLYAVKPDGSGELTARTCTASGTSKGPPAVLTTGQTDVAFGAFSSTQLVASAATNCAFSPIRDVFSAGASIDLDGAIVGVTAKTGVASVRRYSFVGAAFEELWSVAVGTTVSAAPIFDASGRILTGGQDAGLDRTEIAGASAPLATLTGSVDEQPIVLSNGDIVVGDASGRLHRLAADGTPVWEVNLGAAVHAPMALTDGPVRFLVATADGKLHALDDAGAALWEGALTAGPALGPGNIYTPPNASFSIAYFGGADGKLYAVLVEGRLDTAAPWPKAWHDTRNTSRAGAAF
ncbi:MAG TPA: PQQ-binding-like beta-propeller repeat protein [Anaeromyxobacteraceae bacterium]|nr:PQQ-binding-like beta-propeller repeat protein [Anaeromyxobacteraceae bacterium]